MIRLTQPELVHDKKQQESSSPDENTTAIKKEADVGSGTSQGASTGNLVDSIPTILCWLTSSKFV